MPCEPNDPPIGERTWLTIREAARQLGRNVFTIYHDIHRGILPTMKWEGSGPPARKSVISKSDLHLYVSRQRERASRRTSRLPVGPEWVSSGEATKILGIPNISNAKAKLLENGAKVLDEGQPAKTPWFYRRDVEMIAAEVGRLSRPPDGYVWLSDLAKTTGVSRQCIHDQVKRGTRDGFMHGTRMCVKPRKGEIR